MVALSAFLLQVSMICIIYMWWYNIYTWHPQYMCPLLRYLLKKTGQRSGACVWLAKYTYFQLCTLWWMHMYIDVKHTHYKFQGEPYHTKVDSSVPPKKPPCISVPVHAASSIQVATSRNTSCRHSQANKTMGHYGSTPLWLSTKTTASQAW